MRLAASLAVAGVLLCSAGVAGADDAPAGSLGLRLVDVPADPADPRESSYVVATLEPGEQLRRRVEVSNTTQRPLEVQLYVGAASTDGPAGFDFADGRVANELSGWTTVRPSTVLLEAGASEIADVEVAVPAEAVPGEHAAVVWAEQAGSTGGGLTLLSRVGVRMYVEVAGAGRSEGRGPVVVAGGLVLFAAMAALWSAFVQRGKAPDQGASDAARPPAAGD